MLDKRRSREVLVFVPPRKERERELINPEKVSEPEREGDKNGIGLVRVVECVLCEALHRMDNGHVNFQLV